MAEALAATSARMLCPGPSSVDGLHKGTSPPARGRSTKKNGGDQALGRSRGGLSTKIHAATIDENCSVALHLSAGYAHDGRQFESLYESLDPDNVLESTTMDKGYDADRIRERLSYDGVEPVIPPIPTRARKLPYDHARYCERNRIERFFNKVKHSAALPPAMTISKTFFAPLYIVSAFILIRNS
jgi:putative transposase